jgi:hypothetical protein
MPDLLLAEEGRHVRSPRVAFVSWVPHWRVERFCEALNAVPIVPSPGKRTWPFPVRWTVQAIATTYALGRVRPTHVLYTNPPFVLGVLLILLRRVIGYELISDSHSGAFNDPDWTRFSALDARVMRRCRAVIVTNADMASMVEARGGKAIIVSMPPLRLKPPPRERAKVLAATLGYSFDEPVQELVKAASQLTGFTVAFPGNAPRWIGEAGGRNCVVTGWLTRGAYEELLGRSSGVVCLTTRDATIQTGAYEALEAGVPMVLSDTRLLRDVFRRGVVFVEEHTPPSLAEAMRVLLRDRERLTAEVLELREEVNARCRRETGEVERVIRESLGEDGAALAA